MEEKKFFMYKNRPLVRKENIMYYGDIGEDYVCMLTVESSTELIDIKIGNKIFLQLISTDPNVSMQDVVVKHTVKNSLYDALDIAGIWIERYKKRSTI